MGERNCASEGCNALEFRTSGFCLRHKDGAPINKGGSLTKASSDESGIETYPTPSFKKLIGIILMIIGALLSLTGFVWLFDNYVVGQMAGAFLLVIGVPIFSSGLLLYSIDAALADKLSRPDYSFDPSTGMYQKSQNKNALKGQQTSEE